MEQQKRYHEILIKAANYYLEDENKWDSPIKLRNLSNSEKRIVEKKRRKMNKSDNNTLQLCDKKITINFYCTYFLTFEI